jgi:hypothetical protein
MACGLPPGSVTRNGEEFVSDRPANDAKRTPSDAERGRDIPRGTDEDADSDTASTKQRAKAPRDVPHRDEQPVNGDDEE